MSKFSEPLQYANEMNTCGKDKSCLTNTKNKYNAEHNMNKQLLTQAKQKCLNNPFCRWTKQKQIIYNNLQNNRLFDNEITKTPDTIKTVNSRGRKLKNPVLIPGEYVSRVEKQTKENLKNVTEAAISLTPPGRIYNIGSIAVDLVNDVRTNNFDNTVDNVIGIVIPKGLRKIGIPKKSIGGGSDVSDLIGAGVSLDGDLNE